MAKVKDLKPHVDYVEHCLELLRDKLDECNDYMNSIKWSEKNTQDEMEKEFKFQSGLFNNYITWISQYADLSGMVSQLKELNKTDETKDIRKGSSRSAFAEMNKAGELGEDND